MNRMLSVRVTIPLALGLLLFPFLSPSNTPEPHATPVASTKAEVWARAVADFLTDPRYYRYFPLSQARQRFAPLVPDMNLGPIGTVTGRNPATGVLWLDVNLTGEHTKAKPSKYRIEAATFFLPEKDHQGYEVYPILKTLLEKRLQPPVWNQIFDIPGSKRAFWRRGKSHYVISLDLGDYSPNGRWQEAGPYVVAIGAEEQGDSEDE